MVKQFTKYCPDILGHTYKVIPIYLPVFIKGGWEVIKKKKDEQMLR